MRYRDGMTDAEMKVFLASVEELDAAYARAATETLVCEEDEAAEEAAWYEELQKEFSRRR